MPNDERIKAILSDLGRSTLRGVRKCPKCGTLNGIRCVVCKNKACDQVFKEPGNKRKHTTEVCKLITGTSTQIFSVRVKDKGPDHRGFVQFPVQPNSLSSGPTDILINEPSAVCFIDNCQRLFDTSILKCHEKDDVEISCHAISCQHIQAAMRCFATAEPLYIDCTVALSLNIPQHIKEDFWQLTTLTTGPPVQRISKTIMAVKCKVTSKHPLGYLHVSFSVNKCKDNRNYHCSCPAFKQCQSTKQQPDRRCIHYYACVAAFASDEKLTDEFSIFIDQERSQEIVLNIQEQASVGVDDSEKLTAQRVVAFVGNPDTDIAVQVEVLPEDTNILQHFIIPEDITQASSKSEDNVESTTNYVFMVEGFQSDLCLEGLDSLPELPSPEILTPTTPNVRNNTSKSGVLKRKKENPKLTSVVVKNDPKKGKKNVHPPPSNLEEVRDETTVHQTFVQWLATVTERINQQMHFQFNGKPAPLVFHIPQEFFYCLRERISFGGTKKRLPNTTTAFVRKQAIPLGSFTKYSWHINNIFHCKQIFETPLMPLKITRSFIDNNDGTYEDYEATKDDAYSKMNNAPRIRPVELKTFLKVGNTSPDQKVPTPMIIEWIPDILPKTKIGELKITFEFGHQRP